jgi:hypothetical protein
MAPESCAVTRIHKTQSRLPRGDAALGKLTVVGHPWVAGLRRALGLSLIAGLLISAVAFYRAAPQLPRAIPAEPTSPASPTTAEPTSRTATASPSPSPSTKRVPSTSAEGKLPRGPGVTEPGILLMASPLRDGSFDIAEMVILPAAVASVRLGPPDVTHAGGRFTTLKPAASQVQMSADDQPVMVPKGRIDRRLTIAFVEPARRMELRYKLEEVTVRSMPSRAGRALAAIGPLAAGSPRLPVVMMVTGSTVLNIECPMRRQINEQACATGRVPRLRAKGELPRSSALIIVQFNLPRT